MSSEKVINDAGRKEFVGEVVSDKMKKTIVVAVTRFVRHGQYEKTYKSRAKYKAHDEKNEAHVGDKVRIRETRPLSKDKRWRLVEIISKSKLSGVTNDL